MEGPSDISLETLLISMHDIFILLHYTGISCRSTRIQLSISVRIVFRLLNSLLNYISQLVVHVQSVSESVF